MLFSVLSTYHECERCYHCEDPLLPTNPIYFSCLVGIPQPIFLFFPTLSLPQFPIDSPSYAGGVLLFPCHSCWAAAPLRRGSPGALPQPLPSLSGSEDMVLRSFPSSLSLAVFGHLFQIWVAGGTLAGSCYRRRGRPCAAVTTAWATWGEHRDSPVCRALSVCALSFLRHHHGCISSWKWVWTS